jgi:multiple sugar transport system permease protein
MSAVTDTSGRPSLPHMRATPQEIAASRARRKVRENSRKVVLYGILILGAIVFMCPLYWMLNTAVKTNAEAYLYPPTIWPQQFKLTNFPEAWNYEGMQFARWTFHTIFITLSVMVGVMLTSSMCAYGFARMSFPGKNFWFMATLASTMLPAQVTLIPLYILFFKIGWLDTFNPLIIPAWFGGGAINIFLLRQFFMGIPAELEDAALIDGAGRFRIWWSIFIPLSIPAVLTVAIFTFQGVWNDFYGPLVFLTSQDNYTLALGINLFKGLYGAQTQYLMAVSTVMTIPMIVLFFVAQRYFIRGIVLTGINR